MTISSIAYNVVYSNALTSKTIKRTAKTVTAFDNAQISTDQFKFSGSSLKLDGAGDYISTPSHIDFAFGTGAFTLEGWYYFNVLPTDFYFWEFRSTGSQLVPAMFLNTNGIQYYANGGFRISTTVKPTLNTWNHVALCRSGTSTKLFLNGTQIGSTYSDSLNYIQPPSTIFVSKYFGGGTGYMNGYIDELHVTKGLALYTSNFTPPDAPIVGGDNTVLLLHFEGDNGSTAIIDDVY